MADGDPVASTSPVTNGNRCQFLLQCTSFQQLPSELPIQRQTPPITGNPDAF